MALLNYTTKIDAGQTAGEIQNILRKHGARQILIEYDDRSEIVGLSFLVQVNGKDLFFRLPVDADGALQALKNDPSVPNHYKDPDHARNVAWRILKDWVEAQMAFIQAKQARMEQIFLHCLLTGNGQTMYERMQGSDFLQITEGS